jgi:hypothetical protein
MLSKLITIQLLLSSEGFGIECFKIKINNKVLTLQIRIKDALLQYHQPNKHDKKRFFTMCFHLNDHIKPLFLKCGCVFLCKTSHSFTLKTIGFV